MAILTRIVRACPQHPRRWLVISSDAQAPEHFDFLRDEVLTARGGWAEVKDVANTLPPLDEVKEQIES